MGQAIWTCPTCGPISDALFGDDEEFHCSGLECDAVVQVLTDEERKQAVRGLSWQQDSPFKKKRPRSTATARKDTAAAKRILKRVEARKAKRPTPPKKKEPHMPTAPDRTGPCEDCGETKWLLRLNPERLCRACSSKRGPTEASKRSARAPSRLKTRAPKVPPIDDKLAAELTAMQASAAVLDGLDADARERVMYWLAHRYRARPATPPYARLLGPPSEQDA